MTTLNFADMLVTNPFSFDNAYNYLDLKSYGLYFDKLSKNYPFIMKSGISGDAELQYSSYNYQLRGRLLNTKKIKEVMDTSKIPLLFHIKGQYYLIGKGFLSTCDINNNHNLLFIACVDNTLAHPTMLDVKFYVSRNVWNYACKSVQLAIKDIIASHVGDVITCSNILDYVSEKITVPQGGSISSRKKYHDAVVRTALIEAGWIKTKEESIDVDMQAIGVLNIEIT